MTVAALFPSPSYVVKGIVKKQRAAAFEVCQLQDPIKYQMHVCPLNNPNKAAILLYNSQRLQYTSRIWNSISRDKWLQLFTTSFLLSANLVHIVIKDLKC